MIRGTIAKPNGWCGLPGYFSEKLALTTAGFWLVMMFKNDAFFVKNESARYLESTPVERRMTSKDKEAQHKADVEGTLRCSIFPSKTVAEITASLHFFLLG